MTDWRGTRWASEPHIRFGDPCFACGTPMTPASRRWSKFTIPDGYRKHAGNALCSSCAKHPHPDELAPALADAQQGEADPGLLLIVLGVPLLICAFAAVAAVAGHLWAVLA